MSLKKISHISIIMDGNGRWAKNHGMPRAYGHRAGIKSINRIVSACSVRQIQESYLLLVVKIGRGLTMRLSFYYLYLKNQ